MGIRAAASGGAARRALSASLCRPGAQLEPVRRVRRGHHVNQETLIAQAFDLRTPEAQPSLVLSKQA